MSLIRGVLLAGQFRTQHDLNSMSPEDQRNTLIVELAGRTNQPGTHFQSLDDAALAGAGATLVFLREAQVRTDAQLKTISDDDQRNLLIIELGAQTQLSGAALQRMSSMDLVLLALGRDASFIRGVLVAGKFRTHRQLNGTSHEDQRNTLIVELAGRTNQPGSHFQSLDDAALAGAGAALVFLRHVKVRTDAQLKTISDDDQRNLLIIEAGAQTHLPGPVLQSLSTLDLVGETLGAVPGETAIAARSMAKFHQNTGGIFGPLGQTRGPVRRGPAASYVQDYELGHLNLNNVTEEPTGETNYEADIILAAVRCFGTQDRNQDQTYAVMSLMTVDPNNPGLPVQTQRTVIQDGVRSGHTIFKNALHMTQPVAGTSGVMVHIAIWDHESGDADKLRDDINRVLQDSASKAASALGGGDLAGQGGTLGDIMNFEVGGVKPFQVASLGLAGLIAGALADDLVGEHVYLIPSGNIKDLAEQAAFTRSIRPPEGLDFDVQYNWPPRLEDEFLFSDGHGSYKIYLAIRGVKTTRPVFPSLKVA